MMAARGRFLPLKSNVFDPVERPLLVRADSQIVTLENSLLNDRFTLDSGPSRDTLVNFRC